MALARMTGQGTVELLMILVFGLSVLFAGIKILKNADFISGVTIKPWAVVSGMVECGVWRPCGVGNPQPMNHPGNRVISQRPAGQ